MTPEIVILLAQDGIVNAAIYALMAIGIVLVYAVTRIVFVPQGQFASYGALTLAALLAGQVPGTIWILLVGTIWMAALDIRELVRRRSSMRAAVWPIAWVVYSGIVVALTISVAPMKLAQPFAILLTFAILVPLGPISYRIVFQPIANAPVLTLLIVAVALDLAANGLGLLAFGAEGSRNPPVSDFSFYIGSILVTTQSIWVVGAATITALALWLFFEKTFAGMALKATAVNRLGAKLVGIRTSNAGKLSFALASAIGIGCGILIAPLTAIYFNTGFLIGLKGFVAAIIAGLASYPLAIVGAIVVGLLESFSSFWASAYKEVIVFTLIIPVLVARSLTSRDIHEED